MRDVTRRGFLIGAGAVGGVALVGVTVAHDSAVDGGTAEGTGPDRLDAGGVREGWFPGSVDGGGA